MPKKGQKLLSPKFLGPTTSSAFMAACRPFKIQRKTQLNSAVSPLHQAFYCHLTLLPSSTFPHSETEVEMDLHLPFDLKMASSSSPSLSLSTPSHSLLPNSPHNIKILRLNRHYRAISLTFRSRCRLSSNGFRPICCSKAPAVDSSEEKQPSGPLLVDNTFEPEVRSGIWNWRGYHIRYQYAGKVGPALVLIHGFGANSDHWRKNISYLAKTSTVYSIDLIGYGYSEKPNPREFKGNSFYTFETWADQLNDFCVDVVKDEAFFICNSIGGVVGLQAAIMEPQICKGIVLLNISLRMLHIKKQPWYGRPFIKSFQSLLRNTVVGKLFFNAVATPESVRSILCQCYHDTSAVTDELVQIILQPGLDPGAADVFLEFICYSGGPLPEELLPKVQCPVLVAWGDKDPWEPIELGKAYADFDTVEDFVILPNVGHCPQDEAPDLVNPLIETFVKRHNKGKISSSPQN